MALMGTLIPRLSKLVIIPFQNAAIVIKHICIKRPISSQFQSHQRLWRWYDNGASSLFLAPLQRPVPGTSQITFSKAISSTAIQLDWAQVTTAERYFLLVNSTETGEKYNFTFTGLSAVVRNLRPSTAYSFYVFTMNAAGVGSSSRVRTISTCESGTQDFWDVKHTNVM